MNSWISLRNSSNVLHFAAKSFSFVAKLRQCELNGEYVKLYRPADSWQNRFRAVFRLPSPLLDGGADLARAEANLREICSSAEGIGLFRTARSKQPSPQMKVRTGRSNLHLRTGLFRTGRSKLYLSIGLFRTARSKQPSP